MKGVSILSIFQGIIYFYDGFTKMLNKEPFLFVNRYLEPKYNLILIILGILLILSGVGILKRDILAYCLAIIIYTLLILWAVLTLFYLCISLAFDPGAVIIDSILILYFGIVLKILVRHREELI